MKSLSNMKIGRKIGLVLGAIVLLLVGLSALSLWGSRSSEQRMALMIQRATKGRLAEVVTGETAAVGQAIGRMVIAGRVSDDVLAQIAENRKSRTASLDEFKMLADSPTSIKHGADMAEMVQSSAAIADRVMASLKAGRAAEATTEFRAYSTASLALRTKAKEAAVFQENRVVQAEKEDKETASTMLWSLTLGSLFAIAGAIFAGIVLTRGIATPLGLVVAHLGEISQGDLSKDARPELQARANTYLTHHGFYDILCSWKPRKHWPMRSNTSAIPTILCVISRRSVGPMGLSAPTAQPRNRCS